jgi:hypothetical protein
VLQRWFHNERMHEHYKRQAEKLAAELKALKGGE